MIEAKDLKKVYKTKKGVIVKALDGVSLKLPDTGMVFILGKSGSGKSTLLNVLGGLDGFDSGEIVIKGKSARDFKQSHYDSYRNTYIGFIFQEYNILEELTVGANIALAIELQGRRATNEEVNGILAEVDLDGYGARKPNELSGGQKQRVAIARALIKKPEIIMADEPTGALDSATGRQVFDTLKKLSRDKLVLIVSHDREFSEQYADRIIELMDGKIISDVEKRDTDDLGKLDDAPIEFGENEISVKAGYQITEEDRIAINKYLAELSAGAVIKPRGAKRQVSSNDFVNTDESKIVSHKSGDFKLIKSKLSIKNAFKLGSGALKYKKVRLVITIILSLVSFTLFGLADTIAAYNNVETTTNSIYDTGVDYLSFVKALKYTNGDYSYWSEYGHLLTENEIDILEEKTGKNLVGVYKKDVELSFKSYLGDGISDKYDGEEIYTSEFSGLVAVNNELLQDNGFSLLGPSRLPENGKNEIVITKYVYDYFSVKGYMGYDADKGRVVKEIKDYSDIIGEKISLEFSYNGTNEYEIVGIVDTHFDYTRYEPLVNDDTLREMNFVEIMTLQNELEGVKTYSFASICFVNSGLIDTLVSMAANRGESLSGYGNLHIYVVNDDSAEHEWELYEDDRENILRSDWIERLKTLKNVKNDVIWRAEPLESLKDNQIIVSSAILRDMLFSKGHYNDLHDPEKLIGFEKTLVDKYKSGEWELERYPALYNIMTEPRYFAAWKYATDPDNFETLKSVCAEKAREDGYSDIDIETRLFAKEGALYRFFVEYLRYDALSDEYVDGYVDTLTSTYRLESMRLSDAVKSSLVSTVTYEGSEYVSYSFDSIYFNLSLSSHLDEILLQKYAFDNFDDVLNYHEYMNQGAPDGGEYSSDFYTMISMYTDLIRYGDRNSSDYVSIAEKTFDEYKVAMYMQLYEAEPSSGKMLISCDSYVTGKSALIKNVEIVGVVSNNDLLSYGSAVVSEGVMNVMLGHNVGGVFTYAVGVMPETRGEIHDIVRFTDKYVSGDGEVKYLLRNNVTEQLSMVNEILVVLGKVFLYVGIGFAVFASLMLANFISTSVSYKKQEIGILRAIGSRSADVFRIFFAEAFIIAMINYVLSVVSTLAVTIVINSALRNEAGLLITFLSFGIRQIGLLLIVSLAVALIATFLPVKKIASMKPIDAIKNIR